MSLVDAARKLWEAGASMDEHCHHCDSYITSFLPAEHQTGEHSPDCPWLALPQIVAALEAAEKVLTAGEPGGATTDGAAYRWDGGECQFCGGYGPVMRGQYESGHQVDCPWMALRAALRGDGGME